VKHDYTLQKLALRQGFRIQFEMGTANGAEGDGRWYIASSPCWVGGFNFRIHPDDVAEFQRKNSVFTPYDQLKPGDIVVRVTLDGMILKDSSDVWKEPRVVSHLSPNYVHFSDTGPSWASGGGITLRLKVVGHRPPLEDIKFESKARPHAELIKAWADGAEIEHLSLFGRGWLAAANPYWHSAKQYRIKPPTFVVPVVAQQEIAEAAIERGRQNRLRKHAARRVKLVNQIDAIEKQVNALDKLYKLKAIRANKLRRSCSV
jgi:hypothetical protein